MKVPADWLQGAVRFSLGRFNTEEEIRYVNQKVPSIVKRLLGLSALGKLGDQQRFQPETVVAAGTVGTRG
jgi:hypothetical protein